MIFILVQVHSGSLLFLCIWLHDYSTISQNSVSHTCVSSPEQWYWIKIIILVRKPILVSFVNNRIAKFSLAEKAVLGADYMRQAGSVCWDLGTSMKHIKNQLCDYMEKSQPGRLAASRAEN